MKLSKKKLSITKTVESTIVIAAFQTKQNKAVLGSATKYYNPLLQSIEKDTAFSGAKNTSYFFRRTQKPHVLFLGLGKKEQASVETYRKAGALAYKCLDKEKQKSVAIAVSSFSNEKEKNLPALMESYLEGLLLASYSFDNYKNKKKKQVLQNIVCYVEKETLLKEKNLHSAMAKYEAITIARDLSNEPANKLTPALLAKRVQGYAKKYNIRCRTLQASELKKENMGGVLGVGQGSVNPPCLIVLEYKPPKPTKNRKKIAFVGKAVTFDAGGISLKPSMKMDEMKHDMSGGANVIAATLLAAKLGCPNEIRTYIPAAENTPSGSAILPSAVLHMRAKKTVEVLNTDAEGRLILADALDYAQDASPDALIDVATLTGAVVVCLGHVASAIMGNNRELIKKFQQAMEKTGELHWELPIYDEFCEAMKGKVGDLQNISSGQAGAGASTAAAFLKAFIRPKTKWMHIDCAGTAWNQSHLPYCTYGASGHGVRTLAEFALNY